jgi:hypothetical protein
VIAVFAAVTMVRALIAVIRIVVVVAFVGTFVAVVAVWVTGAWDISFGHGGSRSVRLGT